MTHKLVLLRHGQSQWNLENRFTGWVDVDLSPRGMEEAKNAGLALGSKGYRFDVAYTSILLRAVHTLEIVLNELDQTDLLIVKDWHLNERHYGALQGLNKSEMAQRHGADQIQRWRRGYDVRPPAMSDADTKTQRSDKLYRQLDRVPATESLADTYIRVVRFWNHSIAPQIRNGSKVIISAHGNSLRALVKYIDGISDEQITSLNIPTGIPLVYELDSDLNPVDQFYLADQSTLDSAVSEVENQTSADSA